MFALVFTSHQKTRVLRGFPRKQKLNGKKTAYFVQYMVSTRGKKGKKRKKNLWICMMKGLSIFDILVFKTCML